MARHREDYRAGAVATYIPQLAKADLDRGEQEVFRNMREEPSGDAFNSIIKLQASSAHVPSNPYINAGAILTTSLIKGADADEKFGRILAFMQKISETPDLDLDTDTYLSEKATGDTNRALAWMMKSYGDITGEVEDILDVYFRQCSIRVTAVALAKIGRFFAAGGVLSNGERVLTVREARIVVGLMTTCGLYNGTGTYMVDVGIPTKSGVGGGLLAAYSGVGGIGTFSPALDTTGNSVAVQAMMRSSQNASGSTSSCPPSSRINFSDAFLSTPRYFVIGFGYKCSTEHRLNRPPDNVRRQPVPAFVGVVQAIAQPRHNVRPVTGQFLPRTVHIG